MRRKKRILEGILAVIAVAALVAGGIRTYCHDRAMHAALLELQAQNQADSMFTSDSAAQVLVNYFDHPWHNANDQMLAYYLLGRAHADMGEAPQAIEDYQTAVECADTTDQDCDFRLLRNVYGQMAEVFDAQNLPEDELEAQKKFNYYSWVIGDTLEAVITLQRSERALYLLGLYDSILVNAQNVRKRLLQMGYAQDAARALIMPAYIHAIRQQYAEAGRDIRIIRDESDLYDEHQSIISGNEMFYYTLGLYHEGVGQLDSAEYYYRQLLPAREYEAGYKGLLSVYSKRGIPDSVTKFAPLYADANDAMHREMNSAEVHKTTSLYNYNRHLRQVRVSEQKANRRKTFIFLLLMSIAGLCVLVGIIIKSKRKKEQELSLIIGHIQDDLRNAADKYSKTKEELHLAESQLQDYVTAKQSEIKELYEQKQQLSLLYESLKAKDKRALYYSCRAVVRIRSLAHTRKTVMSEDDWQELKSQFQASFPHFCHMIGQRGVEVTDNEWKVCILLDLGLTTDDIAALMQQSAQRISNIKAQTNHLLFDERGGSGLSQNLRFAIHPEEKHTS